MNGSLKRFVRDAFVSFVFWTGSLTPFMLLVLRVDLSQYLMWFLLQASLGPPLGAVSARLFRRIEKGVA